MTEPLLEVKNLSIEIATRQGPATIVDGIDLHVDRGETLGIVGESGCGKSLTMLSLVKLLPNKIRVSGGSAEFGGRNLLTLSNGELRALRGSQIGFVFQDPLTSLNPVMKIGDQISEPLVHHKHMSRADARKRAGELLRLVGIPGAEQRLDAYPHQLSGGMRQRVMIAIGLARDPELLIADEPTTALDVTIQAQILDLILDLQQKLGTAVILITHDLGVVAETAHRVIVMYAGKKVEEAPVEELFARPQHPYTHGLMASIPRLPLMRGATEVEGERLQEIPGTVPALTNLPPGCVFAPRCAHAIDRCRAEYPPYEEKRPGHWAACWRSRELYGDSHG